MGQRREAAWCPCGDALRTGVNEAEKEQRKVFKLKQLVCDKDITHKCDAHVLADV